MDVWVKLKLLHLFLAVYSGLTQIYLWRAFAASYPSFHREVVLVSCSAKGDMRARPHRWWEDGLPSRQSHSSTAKWRKQGMPAVHESFQRLFSCLKGWGGVKELKQGGEEVKVLPYGISLMPHSHKLQTPALMAKVLNADLRTVYTCCNTIPFQALHMEIG